MRKGLKVLLTIVVGCVLILSALPYFISINAYKGFVENKISTALNRPVTIEEISFAVYLPLRLFYPTLWWPLLIAPVTLIWPLLML
jgi:uncharacterized protein involved in outer membrane biogenesis